MGQSNPFLGKAAKHPSIDGWGELTLEQVKEVKRDNGASRVQKLRDSHHMVARMMALGMKNYEIAEATGYSVNRIGMFAGDPAIQHLVQHYREMLDENFVERGAEKMALMGKAHMMSLRQIVDQLEEADEEGQEKIPLRTLLAIQADVADRTGYPKRKESVNFNLDFADSLDKAIERSRQVRQIEARANSGEIPAIAGPSPSRDGVGELAGAARPPGDESSGPSLAPSSPRPSILEQTGIQPRFKRRA